MSEREEIKRAEQLVPHDPDNGIYGDCYRATLATLLGLDTEQVPHFLHDNCDALTFNTRVSDFLAQFGLVYASFNAWDIPQWEKGAGISIPIYHEIADDSPRFSGTGHAVVGKDGEVFHDPHPTKLGLPKVTDARTIGFLVQAAPNAKDKKIAELQAAKESSRKELEAAKQRVAELESKTCDECDGDGWHVFRDTGRVPCVCVTEMEAYQLLQAEKEALEKKLAEQTNAMQRIMCKLGELLDEDQFTAIENIATEVCAYPPTIEELTKLLAAARAEGFEEGKKALEPKKTWNRKSYMCFTFCEQCPFRFSKHDMNCIECCPVRQGKQAGRDELQKVPENFSHCKDCKVPDAGLCGQCY